MYEYKILEIFISRVSITIVSLNNGIILLRSTYIVLTLSTN